MIFLYCEGEPAVARQQTEGVEEETDDTESEEEVDEETDDTDSEEEVEEETDDTESEELTDEGKAIERK